MPAWQDFTRDEVLISSTGRYDLLETESHFPYDNQPESEFGENYAHRKQFQAKKILNQLHGP